MITKTHSDTTLNTLKEKFNSVQLMLFISTATQSPWLFIEREPDKPSSCPLVSSTLFRISWIRVWQSSMAASCSFLRDSILRVASSVAYVARLFNAISPLSFSLKSSSDINTFVMLSSSRLVSAVLSTMTLCSLERSACCFSIVSNSSLACYTSKQRLVTIQGNCIL